jgi:uridine kinase
MTFVQMAYADIIVPRGGDNEVAINLIVMHVIGQLQAVSVHTSTNS